MSERDIGSLRGRSVILYGDGHREKFAFVVDATTPSTTVLHPDDTVARKFAAALVPGASISLGAPVSDGILMADARVEGWSPTVKILTISNPPTLRHVQRRAVYRVPVGYPVRLGIERGGEVMFGRGETVDASEAGVAAIVRGLAVEAGELLSISVELTGGPLLAVARLDHPADTTRLTSELRQAEVRRVRTAAGVGR
jgi:hypothetical protein